MMMEFILGSNTFKMNMCIFRSEDEHEPTMQAKIILVCINSGRIKPVIIPLILLWLDHTWTLHLTWGIAF